MSPGGIDLDQTSSAAVSSALVGNVMAIHPSPILAEQHHEYLVQQLRMYASGQRRNDVYARMRTIAAKLTSDEINGLAGYYRAGFR